MAKESIVFVVEGQLQSSAAGELGPLPGGSGTTTKASVHLSSRRTSGELVRIGAVPGEDVVILQFADGPTLTLHPATARSLLLNRRPAHRSWDGGAPEEVLVTGALSWQGRDKSTPTRGDSPTDVVLVALHVVTLGLKDLAANLVTSHVLARVDGQVEPGVYALSPDSLSALKGSGRKLDAVPQAATQGPLLVLLHGTFVDTVSTFGKLWTQHSHRVRELFAAYAGLVYALDHQTLSASPIANALTLVRALPFGARLHLLTHSRGGLVAEVLARLAGQRGLADCDLAFFSGSEHAVLRKELQQLATAINAKSIRVDRVVRVACPMRGTLLASGRLDAYLSVLKWTLELTGTPVLPTLVDFLGEVARRRADPSTLPGLAAMLPSSPIVQWLNSEAEPIPGDLRVIAGDLQGDSLGSWLKTLLADAFYWTDNDIIVQTRSMYGGTPRRGGATFLLDRGSKVTHFAYFANSRSVESMVGALTQDRPTSFGPIGPLSWAGQDSEGLRGTTTDVYDGRPSSEKPAVFVVPDVLGSHLKVDDQRIWLSLRLIGGLAQMRYHPQDNVTPDGLVRSMYDDLLEYLQASHEVIPFAYDWRRPMEEEARRLADAVDVALSLRSATGQPVRILAHSAGGLVARTMQLERPQVWRRMMSRDGARLIMLGTPNRGSYWPMQVLTGDETFGNTLSAFCAPSQERLGRQIMAEMPGLLQLQADLLDPKLRLFDHETWRKLADDDLQRLQEGSLWHNAEAQFSVLSWGLPPQAVLDAAASLRRRLDAQIEYDLPHFADQLLLIVGRSRSTFAGFEVGDAGFAYWDASDHGDGRAMLQSALLPGVRTWVLDTDHSSLTRTRASFEALRELLIDGDTIRLPSFLNESNLGVNAASITPKRSRPSREKSDTRPADSMSAVFEPSRGNGVSMTAIELTASPLRLTVVHGSIGFVNEPLLLGHYRSLGLSGTERYVDQLLGGSMSASLTLGIYPDAPGSQQIFLNSRRDPVNPWRRPRPAVVVVVGLGEEGKLREQAMSLSVRQGILAWVQQTCQAPGETRQRLALASTLLGSGGAGITPGIAARAIVQGVRQANLRLAEGGWPQIGELMLVELYLERATDALVGVQVLASSQPGTYEVAPTLRAGIASIGRQQDSGYRGADYDFITATTPEDGVIAFTLDSKRARTEVRAQSTQGKLLKELVSKASSATNFDTQIGRTLFQLLVPLEMDAFLGGTSRVLLELDRGTAAIPWEVLDTPEGRHIGDDRRPWAIRSQLLRKLRTSGYRTQVQDAISDDAALVVGEPAVDRNRYCSLPGAHAEAMAVVSQLGGPRGIAAGQLVALTDSPDATQIINALLSRSYRIVHIAGHGEPGYAGGVVMSGDTFLGPREIAMMRTVPELVFVNCCHSAAQGGVADVLHPPKILDRSRFAADTADALIDIGVRCVIAAGWAVDDEPAALFATTFYRQLLSGAPFVAAVSIAREAAWARGGNTWAAYQCYGDPNWTLRASNATRANQDEYGVISSPAALVMKLEEMSARLLHMGTTTVLAVENIRHLEARFGLDWGSIGSVAEAFGNAFGTTGMFDEAIAWFERALRCSDASASMKANERLGSLRARRAFARASGALSVEGIDQAREEIAEALKLLQSLASLQPTAERQDLCGSAWEKLALLELRFGNASAGRSALQCAVESYGRAERMAADARSPELFFPGLSRMAAELVAHQGDEDWRGFDSDATAAILRSLQIRDRESPDFWSKVGLIEIDLLEALAQRRLDLYGPGPYYSPEQRLSCRFVTHDVARSL